MNTGYLWRDSLALTGIGQHNYRPSTTSDEEVMAPKRVLSEGTTSTNTTNCYGGEHEDFLLSVERKVMQLRRNSKDEFVAHESDSQHLNFAEKLATVQHQKQHLEEIQLLNYELEHTLTENLKLLSSTPTDRSLPQMENFFSSVPTECEDDVEVFTENPLLGGGAGVEKTPPSSSSHSFRNRLKKADTPPTPHFQDITVGLKDQHEDKEDESKVKPRLSGLGKTLSFKKLIHLDENKGSEEGDWGKEVKRRLSGWFQNVASTTTGLKKSVTTE